MGYGWADAVFSDDKIGVMNEWNCAVENEDAFDTEFRFQKPTGEVTWIHCLSSPYSDQKGVVQGYIGVCFDVSKRKELADRLDMKNRQFEQAEAIANVGFWRVDLEQHKLEWSDQIFRIHDLEISATPSLKHVLKSYPGDAGANLRNAIAKAVEDVSKFDIESDFITSKGEFRRVRNMGQAQTVDGKVVDVVGTCQDVTDRYLLEQRLRSAANTDALTKIANRALYNKALDKLTDGNGADRQEFTLFLIDLNQFKWVNDTLGHPIGDELLCSVADRLAQIDDCTLIARLGGDEFAVIYQQRNDSSSPDGMATQIRDCFTDAFVIGNHKINMGASIGAAHWPAHGPSVDVLTRNADFALYQAKDDSLETVCYFDEELGARIKDQQQLAQDLKTALIDDEFSLYFQPSFSLKHNKVNCFEALMRWHHPERGLVHPSDFVGALETSGQIKSVGEWVIREACRIASTWPEDIRVAVNVSPVQLQEADIQSLIVQSLSRYGMAPNRLELEVTETVLIDDNETAQMILDNLSSLGVRLALDDFGSGFSSLSYLHAFSFDSVKIDRNFVDDLCNNRDSQAIVKSIAKLGQALNFETIAEGVETKEQLDFLKKQGCDQVQGYYFSAPVPEHEVAELIHRLSIPHRKDQVA